MKVYRFDTRNGTYLGEDFAAPEELAMDNGVTVQSPPEHVAGMIHSFEALTSSWRLVLSKNLTVRKWGADAGH